MIYYTLLQLILFLKIQSEFEFRSIHEVLWIIETDQIPEAQKREIILQVLRDSGLMEVDYEEQLTPEVFEVIHKRGFEIYEPKIIPIGVYGVRLINAEVEIQIILN